MSGVTREEVYPQRLSTSPVLRGLGCVSLVFLPSMLATAFVLGSPALPMLFAVGWAVAVGLERRSIRLDESGLTERFWLRRERHVDWSEVESVTIEPERVHVRTARGWLRADARVERWVRLGRRIAEVLGGGREVTSSAGSVEPETVAAWLGIQPDHKLDCAPPRWRSIADALKLCLLPIVAAGLFALAVSNPMEHAVSAAAVLGAWLAALQWLGTAFRAQRRGRWSTISAGVDGLSIRSGAGRSYLDWGELHSLRPLSPEEWPSPREPGWLVTHETGTFRVYQWHSHHAKLIAAVRLAIDAQIEGQRLPGVGPISEAAISLTRSAEDTAERGLSRAEE